MQGASIDPNQQIQIATVLLQVIATFSLIWIAGVRYLMNLLSSMRPDNPQDPAADVPNGLVMVLSFSIWGSGLLLSSSLLVISSVLGGYVNQDVEGVLQLVAGLTFIAPVVTMYVTNDMINNLIHDGVFSRRNQIYLLIITIVVIFIFLFTYL
jgi:hypothetical protein